MNATFSRAVRSELRKFFTTRLWWGMAAAVLVLAIGFAVLFAIVLTLEVPDADAQGVPTGDATQIANSVYTGGIQFSYLLMLTIGVLQIGSEYRHKTITSTFLATPRRFPAMMAKTVALVLIAAMYGLISMVGSVAAGALMLNLRDQEAFPGNEVYRTLALSLLVLALWALIGLGVGILIPNQVAALLIGVGVAFIVEPVLGLVFQAWDFTSDYIAPYLPSAATQAMVNPVTQAGMDLPAWWVGALTLLAWAGVLAGVGVVRTVRQDIS